MRNLNHVVAMRREKTLKFRGLLPPQAVPLPPGGRLFAQPVYGLQVTIAWLAGQFKTHLCVAVMGRAMPETEIPPLCAGGYYCGSSSAKSSNGVLRNRRLGDKIIHKIAHMTDRGVVKALQAV